MLTCTKLHSIPPCMDPGVCPVVVLTQPGSLLFPSPSTKRPLNSKVSLGTVCFLSRSHQQVCIVTVDDPKVGQGRACRSLVTDLVHQDRGALLRPLLCGGHFLSRVFVNPAMHPHCSHSVSISQCHKMLTTRDGVQIRCVAVLCAIIVRQKGQ